jgi:hypothetical protein
VWHWQDNHFFLRLSLPLGSSLLSSIYNTQLLSLISNYYYITGTLTLGKLRVHECAPLHV